MFPEISSQLLNTWGLRNPEQANNNLLILAATEIPPEISQKLVDRLTACLPLAHDPDRVLADYAQFLQILSQTESLRENLKSAGEVLINLITVFSLSEQLRNQLLQDPEILQLLLRVENHTSDCPGFANAILDSIEPFQKDATKIIAKLQRWKNQQLARIAYAELIFQPRLEIVTQQITNLCESIIGATIEYLLRLYENRWGIPRRSDGEKSRFVAIAMGKLGGGEMSYSNDIQLLCVYDEDGKTDGKRSQPNSVFFDAVATDLAKMLGGQAGSQAIYQIDYQLRPGGFDAPLAITADAASRHYDLAGRTWERQALVKARAVAGAIQWGEKFLDQMTSWIYRRYLSVAEITEIKALKRQIEQLTRTAGEDSFDVKMGHGGIRDIEFVIQFLQLLNGGDLPAVRAPNTLRAIESLAVEGFLNNQEKSLLSENYRFLRNLEHRLQLAFGMQTHRLPRGGEERSSLAAQMGYPEESTTKSKHRFKEVYKKITAENRRVLNHLLHDAFADDSDPAPEVDLILDPKPTQKRIDHVLGQYGFKDTALAYRNLTRLTHEDVPFLSTRRCRYFLATIAGDLLTELSRFPDPDTTLVNLCRTSASLGGKGVLWELFSFNRPSLTLYINLCANSPYLSNILIRNPGMIDELMDGLMLDKLPDFQQQESALAELCKGAEDIDPIVHSFNNAQTLRVGVRDIVGKEGIEATNGALSDIAETCIREWARVEYSELVKRLGEPVIAVGPRAGHIAEFIVLALGKFAGRELSYKNNLDIMFLYEADGGTQHRRSERKKEQVTSNQHFFSELSQRILKRAGERGPYGRLYGIGTPIQFAAQGGPLTKSLTGLQDYFKGENVSLRARMVFCRTRVVLGNELIHNQVMKIIHRIAFEQHWQSVDTEKLFEMREHLQNTASPEDFYHGSGGVADIEFIVQVLQLRHGFSQSTLRQPNTMAALLALREGGLLEDADYRRLTQSLRLFCSIESRLQWMERTSPRLLPEGDQLTKLAMMLSFANAQELAQAFKEARERTRNLFDKLLGCPLNTG
jgi:glutamate-ammonia-ligase adenylyltransferase